MGLLVGFLGGAGKGAANYAQTVQAEKAARARDEQKHQWDMEAEDRRNQFQTERDTTQHKYALEDKTADVEAKREMLRFSVDLSRRYERVDLMEAQKALEAAGGDYAKAAQMANTPNAQKAIMDMGKFEDERANAKTGRAKDEASIRSSNATAAHQFALAKDPHGDKSSDKDNWVVMPEKNEFGEDVSPKYQRNTKNGEVRLIEKPTAATKDPLSAAKRAFASGMSLADINKQAKAKGLPPFTEADLRGGATGGW
jgi:hypothetical protein